MGDQNMIDEAKYCRLCLCQIENSENVHLEKIVINRTRDLALVDKIRDCLGLFIDVNVTIIKICGNCEQTINLIEEFRILCHQTDEIYESIQLQTGDPNAPKQYQEHVIELRKLIQQQHLRISRALMNEEVEVKDFPVEACPTVKHESFDTTSEWTEDIKLTTVLEIKEESLEIEADTNVDINDDACMSEPVAYQDSETSSENEYTDRKETNKLQKLPLSVKLALAKEIKNNPELLEITLSGSPKKKHSGWKTVAQKFQMSIASVRNHWRRLRGQYMSARKRELLGVKRRFSKNKTYARLNAILHSIYGDGPADVKDDPDEDEDDWVGDQEKCITLAKEVIKHPIIWSFKHKDFHHMEKKDETWEQIGAKLGSEMTFLKANWKRLRDLYRNRYIRLLKGCIQSDDPSLRDPLYVILDKMLRSNMRVGARGGAQKLINGQHTIPTLSDGNKNSTQQGHTFCKRTYKIFDYENKLKLAQICQTYEIIWNNKHPFYNNPTKRDTFWDRIATEFGVTRAEIKFQWNRLRGVYRSRIIRANKGDTASDDPLMNEPLYKVLDAMLGNNMQVGSRGGINKRKSARQGTDYEHDGNSTRYPTLNLEKKLQLAEICLSHEVIWNCQHPEYSVTIKREEAWDEIAKHLNITREEVKFQWGRLRNVYRCRSIRLIRGQIRKDDSLLMDPLYKVLDVMLSENMQVGIRSQARSDESLNKPSETESYGSVEERVRLAEEISKHEMIWNVDHPDFHKSGKRGKTWRKIAAKFEVEPHVVRDEWKRFRDYHHAQTVRISQGDLEESAAESLYHTLNQYLSLVCEGASTVTKTDNPDTGQKRPILDPTNNPTVLKRRFTGKRQYDDLGCIKVRENGSVRYHKICELCGKQIERSMFEYHMNGHYGLTPYECTFEGCSKRYGNRITRDRHEIMVHGQGGFRFECDQCGEKFKQRAKYDYHYAIKHKSHEVPCGICGKLLKHKSLIKDHERLHTSSFVCKVCGKVLQKKWSLHVHMRVHTNEKPYPCELCDQRFMLKVQLKTHLLKKHGVQLDELQSAIASVATK
ncbi:uncharacterized protein LOC131425259 [Malaya genurostris]|uniref:uncharacterized protein LOC131425259 n=1 Tax=Malaya genurostris TaxID=325434 RepID=UPI0026F37DD3|nr:uncharacterized protein LOC131425259 [Malaya genurostris]